MQMEKQAALIQCVLISFGYFLKVMRVIKMRNNGLQPFVIPLNNKTGIGENLFHGAYIIPETVPSCHYERGGYTKWQEAIQKTAAVAAVRTGACQAF